MRVVAEDVPDRARTAVLSAAAPEMGRDVVVDRHCHPAPLVAWSVTATIALRIGGRDWLVPPAQALWVPAGVEHTVTVRRPGRGYGILLRSEHRLPDGGDGPAGVRLTPLARELIVHLSVAADDEPTRPAAESLLLGLLRPEPGVEPDIPLPTDPRVRLIAEALLADPSDPRDLADWADATHTGVRTITRLFARETGMSFARWRAHVRVRAAAQLLAAGRGVGATARAVGYRKPAAFSATYRRITGHPPRPAPGGSGAESRG